MLGEQGKQEIPQTETRTVTTDFVATNVKRRSLMEYMILNTLWTKQVNKWPDLSQYFTFIMNFAAPSETKAFNEATEILIKEKLITLAMNGQYMLTISGFDYCKNHYKEFPNEQWWPEEKINKENLKKVLEKSA